MNGQVSPTVQQNKETNQCKRENEWNDECHILAKATVNTRLDKGKAQRNRVGNEREMKEEKRNKRHFRRKRQWKGKKKAREAQQNDRKHLTMNETE